VLGYGLAMLAPAAIHDPNLDYRGRRQNARGPRMRVLPLAMSQDTAGIGVLGDF
jgi:hypothetical protein